MAPSAEVQFTPTLRLGKGGMAEVHLARMSGEGAPAWVALKRIRSDLREDPELAVRFEREARICQALRHPNIVSLLAFGVDAQGPYIALDYVFGRPSSALVKASVAKGRQLPLEVALSITLDAAQGLSHAHQLAVPHLGVSGVIHRDVSPDNILVSYDGVAKLTDFGIARLVGQKTRLTQVQSLKGKLGFLAPELYDGHDGDVRTDVFALGVTLYTLLCGVAPFHGHTEAQLMRSVFTVKPVPPGDLRADLPAELDALVLRCISRDRDERPTSVAGLVEALERALPDRTRARAAVANTLAELFPMEGDPRDGGTTVGGARAATKTVHRSTGTSSSLWRWVAAAVAAGGVFLGGTMALTRWPRSPVAPPPPSPSAEGPKASPSNDAPLVPPEQTPRERPSPQPLETAPAGVTSEAPSERPAARAKAARVERRRQAVVAREGMLLVRVRPWGQVFVDGDLLGVTPLAPVKLTPGAHSVIVVNPDLNLRRHFTVRIHSGRRRELNVVLDGAN